MWISKKKWDALEKRIADLEEKVQSQQMVFTQQGAEEAFEVLSRRKPNGLFPPFPKRLV